MHTKPLFKVKCDCNQEIINLSGVSLTENKTYKVFGKRKVEEHYNEYYVQDDWNNMVWVHDQFFKERGPREEVTKTVMEIYPFSGDQFLLLNGDMHKFHGVSKLLIKTRTGRSGLIVAMYSDNSDNTCVAIWNLENKKFVISLT